MAQMAITMITMEVIFVTSRENMFSGIFDEVTFKPACTATEAS